VIVTGYEARRQDRQRLREQRVAYGPGI